MSARIVGTKHWDGYDSDDYWARKAAYIQRLKALVRDFEVVHVFLCFRRPDEFAESIYSTMILSGRFRGTFADFLRAVGPIFQFRRQLDAFRSAFEDVRITPFDALAGDLVPAFCRWIGVPPLPATGPRKKVTPDKRLVDWASRTMTAAPDNDEDRLLRARFARSDVAHQLFDDAHSATFWPDPREREEFASRSAVGLPHGFFSESLPRPSVDARLNSTELARVSRVFEAWRAKSQVAENPSRIRSVLSAIRRAGWRASVG